MVIDEHTDYQFRKIAESVMYAVFHITYKKDMCIEPEIFLNMKRQLTGMLSTIFEICIRLGEKRVVESAYIMDLENDRFSTYVEKVMHDTMEKFKREAESLKKNDPETPNNNIR